MKAAGVVGLLFVAVLSTLGCLSTLRLSLSLTRTVSAENLFAGIIDSRPDDRAFVGWGNIESRHNVFTAYPVQRILVKRPNVFSGIPPNSRITRAVLRVYTKDYNAHYCTDSAKRTYNVHKITEDWNPETLTWRNQPSFQPSPTAQIRKSPKTDVNQWWEFDVTADINSPYGWLIKDETEDAFGFTAWHYIVYVETVELYYEYTLPSYTLTVAVKDSDGSPVSNAFVVSPFQAVTDSSGQASATLPYGTYAVTVVFLDKTYTQTVVLDTSKTVSLNVPKYTLTVKVVDVEGNPLADAVVSKPVSGRTDMHGTFAVKLHMGKHVVTVNVGSKEATQTVDLTADTTVTFALAAEFPLKLTVKDQCGNPLPALVSVDGQSFQCDSAGTVLLTVASGTRTVAVTVQVGNQTFSAVETILVTKSTVKEIVVARRFYWIFYVNCTDGSVPAYMELSLSSSKETVVVPVVNGVGEAYLLDDTYRVNVGETCVASVSVAGDGEFYATLNKKTFKPETSPVTAETSAATTPAPAKFPVYMFFTAVLAAAAVVAIVVLAVKLRR